MQQNPYDDAQDAAGIEPAEPARQRVSLLAVFSLISSLACCIPLSGVLGMGLGGSALLAIGSSQGRLTGKPAAVVGLILGLMVTALQGALIAGGVLGWNFYVHRMAPAAGAFVQAAHDRDAALLRPMLAGALETDVSDEQIFAFAERVTQAYGEPRGAPTRMRVIFPALMQSFERARGQANQGAQINYAGDVVPVPVVLSFALDEAATWVFFDEDSLDQAPQQARIVDMLIELPDGSYAALLAAGPAQSLADEFGYTVSFIAEEVGAVEED